MQRTRAIPVAWLNSGLCPDRPKGWIPIIIIIISRLTVGPTHLYLVLRLRMSGAIPPLPHMLPWHTQGWLYLYIAFTVSSLPLTLLVLFNIFLYHDFMLYLQNKGPNYCNRGKNCSHCAEFTCVSSKLHVKYKFRYVGNDICKERTG